MPEQPAIAYVNNIPDLITGDDYAVIQQRKLVRFRLQVTDDGLEIIGDSPYPCLLDDLLEALSPQVVEKILCG